MSPTAMQIPEDLANAELVGVGKAHTVARSSVDDGQAPILASMWSSTWVCSACGLNRITSASAVTRTL